MHSEVNETHKKHEIRLMSSEPYLLEDGSFDYFFVDRNNLSQVLLFELFVGFVVNLIGMAPPQWPASRSPGLSKDAKRLLLAAFM